MRFKNLSIEIEGISSFYANKHNFLHWESYRPWFIINIFSEVNFHEKLIHARKIILRIIQIR